MRNRPFAPQQFVARARRTVLGWPKLEQRVAALRSRMYAGRGFHYHLEQELSGRKQQLEDIITGKTADLGCLIAVEVCVQCLYSDVRAAEVSADEWDRQHPEYARERTA